jgi:hypothetical protein
VSGKASNQILNLIFAKVAKGLSSFRGEAFQAQIDCEAGRDAQFARATSVAGRGFASPATGAFNRSLIAMIELSVNNAVHNGRTIEM